MAICTIPLGDVSYYVLDAQGEIVPLGNEVMDWVDWHESHLEQAFIGREEFLTKQGLPVWVSTRFFGTTNFPFETLVSLDGEKVLATLTFTREEAEKAHQEAINLTTEQFGRLPSSMVDG